jgi:hypothetical protein
MDRAPEISIGAEHKEHHPVHNLMTTLHRLSVAKVKGRRSAVLLMEPPTVRYRDPSSDSEPRWRTGEREDPWGERSV